MTIPVDAAQTIIDAPSTGSSHTPDLPEQATTVIYPHNNINLSQ